MNKVNVSVDEITLEIKATFAFERFMSHQCLYSTSWRGDAERQTDIAAAEKIVPHNVFIDVM